MASSFIEKMKNFKLHTTLILSFTLIISLTVCCIVVPSYYLYKRSMVDQLAHSRLDLLAQISNNIQKIKDEIITVSDLYYHDQELVRLASTPTIDANGNNQHLSLLDGEVKDTLSNYDFDYQVQLICNNGYTYSTMDMSREIIDIYPKQLWYTNLISSSDEHYWLSSLTVYGNSPTEEDYFSLIRKIKDPSGETKAILIVSVNERILFDAYKNQVNNGSSIYLVDKDGRIITHPVETMIGRVFYDMKKLNAMFAESDNTFIQKIEENYLFSKYEHPDYEWITIEEIPLKNILKPILQINSILLSITFVVAFFSFVLSMFIANSLSHPLSSVYVAMQKAQHGDFSIAFPQKGFAEAKGIAIACEDFVKKIVTLHQDLRSKDLEKHKLEFDFLQAQINPHFLYNTFFTIKCMVDMNYNAEACMMIDSLTAILKASLNNSGQHATIESEMSLLEQYGYILLKRYKGLFTMTFDIDPATKDYFILHFILQPLMENAIFHGFSSMKSGGVIMIRTAQTENHIILTIKDNGCGMPQSTIDEMYDDSINYDHIGLKNVYRRVKLHYNDDAHMVIDSNPSEGTTVDIHLPKIRSLAQEGVTI